MKKNEKDGLKKRQRELYNVLVKLEDKKPR